LAVAFVFLESVGHNEAARSALKVLRYLLAAEILLLATFALIGALYERRAIQRDAQLYHPPGKLVDIGGYRFHLNCAGSGGPTVVLEYGHQGSYFDWSRVQPEVARFTRVCYYDRAGYGWSDPSPRPRTPSWMSDELRSLLHAAGEKPPYILVAHSYGSVNAEMFAHKFPDEVAALVLVEGVHTFGNPKFQMEDRLQLRAMQYLIPFGLPRWRQWTTRTPRRTPGCYLPPGFIRRLLPRAGRVPGELRGTAPHNQSRSHPVDRDRTRSEACRRTFAGRSCLGANPAGEIETIEEFGASSRNWQRPRRASSKARPHYRRGKQTRDSSLRNRRASRKFLEVGASDVAEIFDSDFAGKKTIRRHVSQK
jgi:pimeloyl-ACP methyl ester carboxylesterase